MEKTALAQALVNEGVVAREQEAEAVLDALASVIWHAVEHDEEVDWPRVGRFVPTPAPRRRKVVMFVPASELDVAVNRHHVDA
jgi:nucleoid DNA-binding protein